MDVKDVMSDVKEAMLDVKDTVHTVRESRIVKDVVHVLGKQFRSDKKEAYQRVQAAREKGRPTSKAYIDAMLDSFVEFHGDRRYSDDAAVIGGIGMLGDIPVTVIGLEKGTDLQESIQRNFGAAHPEGYRKALRLMKQAEKFRRPVICLVDTSGAYCGIGAEERGQGQAIAENLMEMMTLKTPIITILIGEGGSGGALALAVSDQVWMMENAIYSVISPEGCASILYKDSGKMKEAAYHLKLTAQDLLEMDVVEQIISEPDKDDFSNVYATVRQQLIQEFRSAMEKDVEELLEERYRRFRKFGN